MKFSLTIATDSAAELAGILAQISGAQAPHAVVTFPTASVAAPADDGSDGPADANAPAFDSAGLPWDDRIHAASKTTNKDGTWRGKRNVTETMVATVTAELRSRSGMAQAPTAYQQPQQFVAPVAPVQPEYQQPQQFVAPVAPVQPAQTFQAPPVQPAQQFVAPEYQQPQQFVAPVAPVQPVQQAQGMDFSTFMGAIQRGMTNVNPHTGTPFVDQAYIASLVGRLSQHIGRQLNAITDIHSDPAAIGVAAAMLQQDGRLI